MAGSPFSPFRHAAFAVLWSATVASNVGSWMHDVAAGWLMTSLSPSPLMVALVQTATALPVFLLALPAGALADIVDRRKLLIAAEILLACAAAGLGFAVLSDRATPAVLLGFTLVMGSGAAFAAPAWQAIVPRLVPRDDLRAAIALNSVGINISRAIGPALAGFIIAASGVWAPFLINAASFVAIIAALLWWRPPPAPERTLPPEHLPGAMRAGMRYVLASPPLRAALVRSVAFFVFASAYWALLPLVVRAMPGGGPTFYGILLGSIGAGAVGGALLLPRIVGRFGPDATVAAGTFGTVASMLVFAFADVPEIAAAAGLLAGAAWIAVLSCLNVAAQTALPDWVRGRGLAVFITVFFGAMTAGSLTWGQAASLIGIPGALGVAAAGAAAMVPLTRNRKLARGEMPDLTPSLHWPAAGMAADVKHDRGPVMVTVEYDVDPAAAAEFLALMKDLEGERRRDGAYAWGVFEDTAAPGRFLEWFLVESWIEHQRQHARVTRADAAHQARIRAFHVGAEEPRVRHFVAPG